MCRSGVHGVVLSTAEFAFCRLGMVNAQGSWLAPVGHAVLIGHKEEKSGREPVRISVSTHAGTIGRIGRSNLYVDCILKLLFLHNVEYVYQVTPVLCWVQISTVFDRLSYSFIF